MSSPSLLVQTLMSSNQAYDKRASKYPKLLFPTRSSFETFKTNSIPVFRKNKAQSFLSPRSLRFQKIRTSFAVKGHLGNTNVRHRCFQGHHTTNVQTPTTHAILRAQSASHTQTTCQERYGADQVRFLWKTRISQSDNSSTQAHKIRQYRLCSHLVYPKVTLSCLKSWPGASTDNHRQQLSTEWRRCSRTPSELQQNRRCEYFCNHFYVQLFLQQMCICNYSKGMESLSLKTR